MRRFATLYALLACSPLAYAQTATPDQIEFNFKYKPGKVIRQRLVDKTVGSMKLPDPLPEMKFAQTFEQVLVSECRKVNPDGSAVFDMSIAQVAMKMNMGPISFSFDSSQPAPQTQPNSMDPFLGRLFSAMVGAKFTSTVSNTGQVQKVEGLSEAVKKVLAGIVDANTPAMVREGIDQLAEGLSDDFLTQQLQSCYRMLPGKKGPYRIGDKWEQQWSSKAPLIGIGISQKGEYQLVGIEQFRGRPCAKVRFKETMTVEAGSGQDAQGKKGLGALFGKMDFRMSSSGGEGVAYVDYVTGEPVQVRQVMDFTIQLKPKSGAQAKAQPGAEAGAAGDTSEAPIPAIEQKLKSSISLDLEEPPTEASSGGTASQPKP